MCAVFAALVMHVKAQKEDHNNTKCSGCSRTLCVISSRELFKEANVS